MLKPKANTLQEHHPHPFNMLTISVLSIVVGMVGYAIYRITVTIYSMLTVTLT
jgi:hypothetical protein